METYYRCLKCKRIVSWKEVHPNNSTTDIAGFFHDDCEGSCELYQTEQFAVPGARAGLEEVMVRNPYRKHDVEWFRLRWAARHSCRRLRAERDEARERAEYLEARLDESVRESDLTYALEVQERVKAERDAARAEVARLREALNIDKTGLASGLNEVRTIAQGYLWLGEPGSWGSYSYEEHTCKTLRREIGESLDAILATVEKHLRASGELVQQTLRLDPPRADEDPVFSRWAPIAATTNSSKMQFVCLCCGRTSVSPTKVCQTPAKVTIGGIQHEVDCVNWERHQQALGSSTADLFSLTQPIQKMEDSDE
jgi:hypothetical protein